MWNPCSDKIIEVKVKIQNADGILFGVSLDEQYLTFDGEELNDLCTIADYPNIKNESRLKLIV